MHKNIINHPYLVALSCVGIMVLAFVIQYHKLPPQVPLFFSLPQGDGQIADLWMLIIFPILVLLLTGLHGIYTKTLLKSYPFLQEIIEYISPISSIVLTLIYLKIVFLIT
ncbi:MAG: hypothetical protein ACMG6E_01065 [Candidatus Roizmanbacteria bacterium]